MDKDLHAFLDRLEAAGELVRVSDAVSRDLEITEIIDRVCKGPAQSNRALLFDPAAGFGRPGPGAPRAGARDHPEGHGVAGVASDPDLLARGRRAIHHAAPGDHARP